MVLLLDDEARVDVRREVHLLAGDGALDLALLAALLALGRRERRRKPVARRQRHVLRRRGDGSVCAAHAPHGRPHDQPDEQVQEHEDADLEDEQNDVDHAVPPRGGP